MIEALGKMQCLAASGAWCSRSDQVVRVMTVHLGQGQQDNKSNFRSYYLSKAYRSCVISSGL
ncbi:hypothetical protein NCCP436_20970 [Pseudomonas sp. NCCP-436]|nr:hypothetical protein NCCP436_20970 [Pseudomonas sp. NCCP-436]